MKQVPLNFSLASMFQEAARIGAEAALIETGLNRENVSRAYANRRYGKTRVDRWIASGKLRITQDELGSSKNEIKKVDLMALDAGERLVHHIDIT